MFDNNKVKYLTVELEKFAQQHKNVYVMLETIRPEIFSLLKRMNILSRAILVDNNFPITTNNLFGIPVIKVYDAIKTFDTSVGIILLKQKAFPTIINNMALAKGNQNINVPVFSITIDETLAIYDYLTLQRILQQYTEDSILIGPTAIIQNMFRGLTTMIGENDLHFKCHLLGKNNKIQYDIDDTAIIIQGPIMYENHYTENTIKHYRKLYPKIPIVISTWHGEVNDEFRTICNQNFIMIVESQPPNEPSFGNVYFQLTSSFNGIKFISENTQVKYALKCRTDQRINRPDFLLYFRNLLNTFKPFGNKLNGRLIFCKCYKFIPFWFCDYLSFGEIADILKLYDLPRQQYIDKMRYTAKHPYRWQKLKEKNASLEYSDNYSLQQSRKLRNYNEMINHFADPEIYIMRNFYKKYIAKIDETKLLETHLKFIHDYILIVGEDMISLDWPKYEPTRYFSNWVSGTDFSVWLNIYKNFK